MLENVGPDRLRAGIAAPCTANRAGDQEQADTGHDQHPGDEIEFVRPDLDREHVETAVGEIDQNRLVGREGTTVPAQPRGHVVDRERDQHDEPFEAPEWSVDPLVVDLLALLVELFRKRGARRLVRLMPVCRRARFRDRARNRFVGLCYPALDDDRPVTVVAWLAPVCGLVSVRVGHRLRPPVRHQPRQQFPRSLRLPRANGHRRSAS